MRLFKTRKRRIIEHWKEMAERYDVLADEAHRSADAVPKAVHFRCVAALYRFNAAELEGKR